MDRQNAILRMRYLIESVRAYMRDYPELNRLVSGKEHSDRAIAMALFDTLDSIRAIPPPIPVDLMSVPVSLLRQGAANFLLESLSILLARNHLDYRSGNSTGIGVQNKASMVLQQAKALGGDWRGLVKEWKISQNISAALGGSPLYSEYAILNGLYGYWGV